MVGKLQEKADYREKYHRHPIFCMRDVGYDIEDARKRGNGLIVYIIEEKDEEFDKTSVEMDFEQHVYKALGTMHAYPDDGIDVSLKRNRVSISIDPSIFNTKSNLELFIRRYITFLKGGIEEE